MLNFYIRIEFFEVKILKKIDIRYLLRIIVKMRMSCVFFSYTVHVHVFLKKIISVQKNL